MKAKSLLPAKLRPKYRIEVFKSRSAVILKKGVPTDFRPRQEWYWHLQSLVGTKPIICVSESFSRSNALRAARRMVKLLAVPVDFVAEPA